MRGLSLLLPAVLALPGPAAAVTRSEIVERATRAADRLATLRAPGRTWEDAPFLVGVLLLAERLEPADPGRARLYREAVRAAIGPGTRDIRHGDYAGYAQASLDLYRLDRAGDPAERAAVLATADGPLAFARRAIRTGPSDGPPLEPWWVDGGYGTRFWVDDLFTQPPWLAMAGSNREGLPGDADARDLAYEWIESTLYDHRPREPGAATSVPSARRRGGPFLWNPDLGLFRHDAGVGSESYWGRGNGWAAWGLARSAPFLDAPYAGGRYDEVVDRAGIREVLARLASALASRRAADGGWPADLAHPGACPSGETSGTGLVAYMLARGIEEGWLDRDAYRPVLARAFALLLTRVDAAGDVSGIQPPGTGPACDVGTSADPSPDLSYGVGAFLLAASQVLALSDEDLALLDGDAAAPAGAPILGRTWIVALPRGCEGYEVLLFARGPEPVRVRVDPAAAAEAGPVEFALAGAGATVPLAPPSADGELVAAVIRASGDLDVRPRAACGSLDPQLDVPRLRRVRPWPAGVVSPLANALAASEVAAFARSADASLSIGGMNHSRDPVRLAVEISAATGAIRERVVLEIGSGRASCVRRLVRAGERIRLVNESASGAVVPLLVPDP